MIGVYRHVPGPEGQEAGLADGNVERYERTGVAEIAVLLGDDYRTRLTEGFDSNFQSNRSQS